MARGAEIDSGPLETPRANSGVFVEPVSRGGGTPPKIEVRLLNGFGVVCSGAPVALPPSAERVLALVALRGRSSRAVVAGTLWSTRTEDHAAACLRTALWRTRKICPTAVVAEGESIGITAHADVDVTNFVATARQVIGGHVPASAEECAVERLNQELLPGWDDDWVTFERDRLRQLGLHALETLATRLSARGRHREALQMARRAVAVEPLRESSRRILTEVHLAEGNVREARQLYEDYRRVLETELGLRPSCRFDQLLEVPPAGNVLIHRQAPTHLASAAGPPPVALAPGCSRDSAHLPRHHPDEVWTPGPSKR